MSLTMVVAFTIFYITVILITAIIVVSIRKSQRQWDGDGDDLFVISMVSVAWPITILAISVMGIWKVIDKLTDVLGNALRKG